MRISKNEPANRRTALVVDDESTSALILSAILESQGLSTKTVDNAESMTQILSLEPVDIVFLDYKLGRVDGLELLCKIVKEYPRTKVVMITAHGSIDLAVSAMRKGASGFVTKPFDEAKVAAEIARIVDSKPRNVGMDRRDFRIVGASPAMSRIYEQIERMKDVETTVLISGESGTGKELVARALHERSVRAKERFEAINCAAIPENLLESELFGHKRGAFTDAKTDRKGLFEVCTSGTLFLDEIGELPLPLQGKLLRALQEKVVIPLGATASVKVGTRIVAATNRNLARLVREGQFRKDLYYRLSILQIETPPLRDRPEDIVALANHFVEEISERFGRKIQPLSPELLARLSSYEWPGNVRELQNALERAIILAEDGVLQIDDVFRPDDSSEDAYPPSDVSFIQELSAAKDEFEKRYLEKLLKATKGNVAQASRIAGRIRTDMYRLFSKYEIDPNAFKP
jgi:DNA-binding NtrC family response regulator